MLLYYIILYYMTFKNKKNLSHTKKRIKRKNISRCLSGGGGP